MFISIEIISLHTIPMEGLHFLLFSYVVIEDLYRDEISNRKTAQPQYEEFIFLGKKYDDESSFVLFTPIF